MPAFRFRILGRDSATGARTGAIDTPHGTISTPAFLPVGTRAAVKAVTPRDLRGLGVQAVMANAYHLTVRPGVDVVEHLGGIHALAGWDFPVMTDSGGFQVWSLATHRVVRDDGVTFREPHDGSTRTLTPESVVRDQERIGADIAFPLDVCTTYPASRDQASGDMERTHAWAARTIAARARGDQALFGIVQGGVYPDLRAESARFVAGLPFEGYAVGGVSVGEPKSDQRAVVAASTSELPESAPRHLLGVGHPEDLVDAVAAGIDTFDCVMPTRVARNGAALTPEGRLNLRNAAFSNDPRPVDPGCPCYACSSFSRGAIRHWLNAGEILPLTLLTLHNLTYLLDLMASMRESITRGAFGSFRETFLRAYAGGAFALESASATP